MGGEGRGKREEGGGGVVEACSLLPWFSVPDFVLQLYGKLEGGFHMRNSAALVIRVLNCLIPSSPVGADNNINALGHHYL